MRLEAHTVTRFHRGLNCTRHVSFGMLEGGRAGNDVPLRSQSPHCHHDLDPVKMAIHKDHIRNDLILAYKCAHKEFHHGGRKRQAYVDLSNR
jgi:hypothetical protein